MAEKKKMKGKNILAKTAKSVTGAFKKTVTTVKAGSKALAEKKQTKAWAARLEKYNPLFPEVYQGEGFAIPNLVVIRDDAERKGIDVCEGAIGWTSKEKDVEVLHLYDEALAFSGLRFIPAPVCDTAYYVDAHDRKTFISMDMYFSIVQQEKLAELQDIAFCLGAKRFWVEMVADKTRAQDISVEGNIEGKVSRKKNGVKGSDKQQSKVKEHSRSVAEASFEGQRTPVLPTLSWFADDRNVLNLIKMRCAGGDTGNIKQYTIELSNTSGMSLSTAAKVDAAMGAMKMKCNVLKKSTEEHSHKMLFKLEF